MRCADIYKLIYQAAMGSAHSIISTETARKYFSREISNPGTGPAEPVVDTIAHDGSIVRVNIRPYLLAGCDTDKLFDAFIRTGREFNGSPDILELYCNWITGMMIENLLNSDLESIDSYLNETAESGYPSVHHSQVYRKAYSPSYRVISSSLIEELGIIN